MDERNAKVKKQIILIVLISIVFGSFAIAQSKKSLKKTKSVLGVEETNAVVSQPLVTFVELGSVNCIPCKAMRKVMKAVEEKYGSQIKITFYDVWKPEQAHYGEEYKIRLIPTQVFLDAKGKELMRHEGFFPEKDIDAFLQSKSLKPKLSTKE
jgi:thioredoxin 1